MRTRYAFTHGTTFGHRVGRLDAEKFELLVEFGDAFFAREMQSPGAVVGQNVAEHGGVPVEKVLVRGRVVEVFPLVGAEKGVRKPGQRPSERFEPASADVQAHALVTFGLRTGTGSTLRRLDRLASDRDPADGRSAYGRQPCGHGRHGTSTSGNVAPSANEFHMLNQSMGVSTGVIKGFMASKLVVVTRWCND